MARRTPRSTAKPPAERERGATYFYAAEVVQILGLDGIDYAQLRRLLRLVRPADAQPSRRWARFSFEDLVGLRVALRLAGGTEALAEGRRLQLAELERTCARLRQLGVARPLLDVPLRREGRAIVAEIDGVTFRPATGQLALTEISRRVGDFLGEVVEIDRPAIARFRGTIEVDRTRLNAASKTGRVVRQPRSTRAVTAFILLRPGQRPDLCTRRGTALGGLRQVTDGLDLTSIEDLLGLDATRRGVPKRLDRDTESFR